MNKVKGFAFGFGAVGVLALLVKWFLSGSKEEPEAVDEGPKLLTHEQEEAKEVREALKNPVAQELGRKGGIKSGQSRRKKKEVEPSEQ